MTHIGPLPESAGEFTDEHLSIRGCSKCAKPTNHKCETWDSSCGGYTDYKYTCLECSTVHWVDGIDS